jgi:hypothetical protein
MRAVCSCATPVTSTSRSSHQVEPAWHARFLDLVPAIRRHARVCFHHRSAEAREEAVAEVLAHALVAYVQLESLGKANLAYATVLARYAVGRYREGRRIGGRSNASDVMSVRCLRRHGVVVEQLHQRNDRTGAWNEILIEDRTAGPDQIAAIRLDFAACLQTLPARDRQLAETLAAGETTSGVGRMFQISAGRVSQVRQTLCQSWHSFIGELADAAVPSVATA